MIKIFLGNLGSGKSLCAVRDIVNDDSGRVTFTNIMMKPAKNIMQIKPENVITRNEDKLELNTEYWSKQKKPLNIVWDEIHLTANARSSMSKVNMVFSKFLAMARRITGFDDRGYGHFIFIAQTERTIDINIKELASEIRYFKSHWFIVCEECESKVHATSEMEQIERCIVCGSWKIKREGLNIEVRHFANWFDYLYFIDRRKGKFHTRHYMVNDAENYFKYYDTLQMEDIWQKYLA